MMSRRNEGQTYLFIEKSELQRLIDVLRQGGYTVIGPMLDQNAIVYGELETIDQLPLGWSDVQAPGSYRLQPNTTQSYFGYNVGPHSWKQFLFPPQQVVATCDRTEQGWVMQTPKVESRPMAFLGVRACELAALAIQDRVFNDGPFVDPVYHERRSQAFVIAVQCTQAASTCFCTSMGTGPECTSGFDLALTEIKEGFVINVGTRCGRDVIEQLQTHPANSQQLEEAQSEQQRAIDQMTKKLDTEGIHELLMSQLEHPRWEQVAERCLSCTNCTMVCPTCFCSTVTEVTDLQGEHVERTKSWDSCFNLDFSYVVGGNVRNDRRGRYRQWLTHKFATWIDQFGTSGCVGCGRCITWCPVGIDVTEEIAAIRREPMSRRMLPILRTNSAVPCSEKRCDA